MGSTGQVTEVSTPTNEVDKNVNDNEIEKNNNADAISIFHETRPMRDFNLKTTLYLAFQTVGVIYGDIGTSPLYVYSSTFSSQPAHDDLLGAVSLIIWTLFFIVTIKYVLVVLHADDDGEGGTFALYCLLAKYANLMPHRNPDEEAKAHLFMKRHKTMDLMKPNRGFRNAIETSRFLKYFINVLAVSAVCMVLSDGVLTPAQSVLGAIQGLTIVDPTLSTSVIVGVSCAILVFLFVIQPFGTSKIAVAFSPIITVWLLFNFVFGIYNLVKYDSTVLKAFNPYYCYLWFARNGTDGWKSLGGILLAFTGVEALFADLGNFSRRAVQISWIVFVFPCLLLAYIGQAAFISSNDGAYSNPFFAAVPPGMFYPSLVVAILAAIVASQAMITGAFAILSQAMALSYFPKISIVHTSERFYGQIYMPIPNWILMILTILVTAIYNNTTSLGNAYGVCVVSVTFISTLFISMVAIIVWKTPIIFVLIGFLFFATIDGMYLSSVLTKVPQGAWFTLMLAAIFAFIMYIWRFGKVRQWRAERVDRIPESDLIQANSDGTLQLGNVSGERIPLTQLRGLGIFFDERGYLSPSAYVYFLLRIQAYHKVVLFVHLKQVAEAHVGPDQQVSISLVTGIPNAYRIVIHHGYRDHLVAGVMEQQLIDKVRSFLGSQLSRVTALTQNGETSNMTTAPNTNEKEKLEQAYKDLEQACQDKVVYVVGKAQLVARGSTTWVTLPRRILLSMFIFVRSNLHVSSTMAFGIPSEKLVEIGYIKEL